MTTLRDLRHALRGFLRDPVFTGVTVLTLGLGIGASTAVFSVVDGVLLEPLPYDDPEELVTVVHAAPGLDMERIPNARAAYLVYREEARSFEALALHSGTTRNLTGLGEPLRIVGRSVTPSLFPLLGAEPALGRTFTEAEGRGEEDDVVLLSHGLWTEHFGGDPGVLGRTVELNGVTHRVVGVMPEGFDFPDDRVRFWLPMAVDPATTSFNGFNEEGIGRLAPGVTPEAARDELQGLIPRLAERFPEVTPALLEQSDLRARVHPYADDVVGDVRTALWVLLASVGFVLLLACANVANLMLVRAEGRRREVAVRSAIGAGRGHLISHFMTESLTLSAAGALLGVGLAGLGLRLLRRLGADSVPRLDQVDLDGSVLLFTVGVTVASALVFGLIPLLRHRSADPAADLRDGSRSSTGGRGRVKARELLVAAQVALALVLLVGSGLMVRSFDALRDVDPGFESEAVLTFHRTLLERIEGLAGVEAVGAVTQLPVTGMMGVNGFYDASDPPPSDAMAPVLETRAVTPGYFEALGIPVRRGRGVEWTDGVGGERVIVLSERAVRTVLGDEPPLGAGVVNAIAPDPEAPVSTVVGVVGDVHNVSLVEEPMGTVYYGVRPGEGLEQGWLVRSMSYAVRTSGDPLALASVVREEVRRLDPQLPVASVRTMESLVADARARTVVTMTMLVTGALMGLVLGAVGLYGVISHVTARRTREIGLRMALGAEASGVVGLVLKRGMAVTTAGLLVGLAGAWAGSRYLESLLYGVPATDPVTYGGVSAALLAVSFLAAWIPARRAAGVDVMEALRSE